MEKNRCVCKKIPVKKYFFVIGVLFTVYAFPVSADTLNDQRVFTVDSQYDSRGRSEMSATLQAMSDRAYFYVEDDYWQSLTSVQQTELAQLMATLGREFDQRIYPTETAFFGPEPSPGIDGDPRITFVLGALRSNVGGYYDSTHQYSRREVPSSNEREMLFLNAASFRDTRQLFPFIAHEFQHMISFNQKEKLRGVSDDIWLNELRSEYAPILLGYQIPYAGSSLERRVTSFLNQPSDSLTEWKNLLPDYGQIVLLGEYLAEHWSGRVVADTLTTSAISIPSIEEALARNGFRIPFSDVFVNWMAANFLNSSALGTVSRYTDPSLEDVRVRPTFLIPWLEDRDTALIALAVKDWEQRWYDIQGLTAGSRAVLTITSQTALAVPLHIPYLVFRKDGSVGLENATIDAAHPTLYIRDVGTSISRVVLMPYTSERLEGFSSDEPQRQFTLELRRVNSKDVPTALVTPEVFGLREGDFIRAEGDKDIFIINQYGYKRIVLSPEICRQYGHLGARGCFDAVHVVAPSVRDAFTTSPYYTNGETNDGRVHRLVETGEDSAYLQDLRVMLYAFQENSFGPQSVFWINTREQRAYRP